MSEEIKQNGQLSSANFAIKTEDYKSYTPYMVYDKKMQEKDQNIIILKAENKRLREALEKITTCKYSYKYCCEGCSLFEVRDEDNCFTCLKCCKNIAKQALGGTCD